MSITAYPEPYLTDYGMIREEYPRIEIISSGYGRNGFFSGIES